MKLLIKISRKRNNKISMLYLKEKSQQFRNVKCNFYVIKISKKIFNKMQKDQNHKQ